jgi:hypothetical protein
VAPRAWAETSGGDNVNSTALFGFLGVLLGSIITSTITLMREQLISKRERQEREEQRVAERNDQRSEFQRNVILALQDAAADVYESVLRFQQSDMSDWKNRSRLESPMKEVSEHYDRTVLLMEKLQARVFDSELRDLTVRFGGMAASTILELPADYYPTQVVEFGNQLTRINQRVGVLLSGLF